MRKITLCLIFIVFFTSSKAQNLSYGALIGGNFYLSNNDSSSNHFSSDANPFAINLGGYVEYNFNENVGIKTDFTFNKKKTTLREFYQFHI